MYFIGVGMYNTVIYRVVDRDMFISILATFGISILAQQLMNSIFGSDEDNDKHRKKFCHRLPKHSHIHKKHDGGEFGHKTMVDILESSNVLILPQN